MEYILDERYDRYAQERGIADTTAQADKRGLRTVLERYGVSEDDELTDDLVNRAIDHFLNENTDDFTPGSRKTYASRARKVWQRVQEQENQPRRMDRLVLETSDAGPAPSGQPPATQEEGPRPMVPVYFPLRHDHVVEFKLPSNFTSAEAERFANFIRTLVINS
jgi:hypothetical protein